MAIAKKKSPKKRNRATLDLLNGMAEMESWVQQGLTLKDIKQKYPHQVRVRIPAPEAGSYPPPKVKSLREKIGVSQGDFADLIGVSRILVQSWERGVREPSPLARRLLDTVSRDPFGWIASLQATAKSRPRRAG